MIKTIKKLALLFIALAGILSCNKWLEATSSTQVSDATLFSSRSGFQDALCGVYISMGEEAEYGAMWSWFVNELAYGPYAQQFSPLFTAIQNHEWDDNNVNSLISQMWKAGYYSIANINKVLYELDAKPDVVSDRIEWNLMKGELLALRAYIHFDLMRMFGLVQLSDADYEKYTVPYVTAYDKEPTFKSDLLIYEGRYYIIGDEHKEFAADKMNDQDYYILTLAAIARELNIRGLTSADVFLAVGLPLTWVSEQKDSFKAYLLRSKEVSFSFRGKSYRVTFAGAAVFPQGFSAVADRLR